VPTAEVAIEVTLRSIPDLLCLRRERAAVLREIFLSSTLEHGARETRSRWGQHGLHSVDVCVGLVHHRKRFLQRDLTFGQSGEQVPPSR
jgi:hypothetical protein